jgi:hypothetical protein
MRKRTVKIREIFFNMVVPVVVAEGSSSCLGLGVSI